MTPAQEAAWVGGKLMIAVASAEANVIARNITGAAEGLARVRQAIAAH